MAWMSDISSLSQLVLALLDPVVRPAPRVEALEDRALVLAPALHGDDGARWAAPDGTLTFRSVRSGRPFSSTMRGQARRERRGRARSPASPRTASETAIDGTPKKVPSRAPPTVPE